MLKTQTEINLLNKFFLHNTDLDTIDLEKTISSSLHKSIDYADLYFQTAISEAWYLEDGIVKSGSSNSCKGFSIRAVAQDKTGLAFSENIALAALKKASKAAKGIAIANKNHSISLPGKLTSIPKCHQDLYGKHNPIYSISDHKKISLLHTINEIARKQDPRISQVIASLIGSHEIVVILTSDGTIAADIRPLIRLNVRVIVAQPNTTNRSQGVAGGGGRFANYNIFLENNFALTRSYIERAVNLALTNLEAKDAPAGSMPVVLGPGWPGILLHEAIGHGLEGDAIRKGSSVFAGKLGTKIASELCTIIDNGCVINGRGSLQVDDEGTKTQATTLIEKGILTNYLQDKTNAKLMGQKSTGNSRRQSYAHLPIPRMTNTYMLSGNSEPESIIKKVANGIYAANFSGGQVDVTSGKFVFEASEAYLIKNGKITTPVKGATLIGSGQEVLQKIVMVGNDLQLDPGIGTCGKDGQNVPVGVGQPTLLISELTVGGTSC